MDTRTLFLSLSGGGGGRGDDSESTKMFPFTPEIHSNSIPKKKKRKEKRKKRVCYIFDHRPRKRWQGWLKWTRKMNKGKKKKEEEKKNTLYTAVLQPWRRQKRKKKKRKKRKSREQILDANKGEKEQITNNVSTWFWYGCLTGIWLTNCAFWAFSLWSALLYYFLKNENQQVKELEKKKKPTTISTFPKSLKRKPEKSGTLIGLCIYKVCVIRHSFLSHPHVLHPSTATFHMRGNKRKKKEKDKGTLLVIEAREQGELERPKKEKLNKEERFSSRESSCVCVYIYTHT